MQETRNANSILVVKGEKEWKDNMKVYGREIRCDFTLNVAQWLGCDFKQNRNLS
jgi:hypothetical protein